MVPYVESHYAARADSQGRAIAGVSLGGGQALAIGTKHPDRFAWIGAFSPALVGTSEGDLLTNSALWSGKLRLLWLSWGDADQLKASCQSLHKSLDEKKVPHVCFVGRGGHDDRRIDLQEFVALLFR